MNDDELLSALHAARPVLSPGPDAASPEARALLEHILRPRRSRLWMIGAPAGVAAAAAVAVGITLASAPAEPGAPPTPARTDLRTAVLAAFDGSAGTVLHAHETWKTGGKVAMTTERWTYPWLAKPGEQREYRQFILAGGRPHQDVEFVYTVPPTSASPKKRIPGRVVDVEYGDRSWSDQRQTGITVGEEDGPARLRQQVAEGHFTVAGAKTLGGRRTIELRWSPDPRSVSRLWVDAKTYQPVMSSFDDHSTSVVTTYEILAATSANRALLRPRIPAGFRQTSAPPAHPRG